MTKGLPYFDNEIYCPVTNLKKWLEISKIKSGPIFRRFAKGSILTEKRLTDQSEVLIMKEDFVLTEFSLEDSQSFMLSEHYLEDIFGKKEILGFDFYIGSLIILFDHPYEILIRSWKGDLLFILAAIFLSIFIILVNKWDLRFSQILYSICIINALFYLPIWFLFLPKGFNFLDYSLYSKEILINIFFQGFVPNIFGLYLTAFAAKSIGTAKASSILAAVPITGAVLGFFILSEIPSFLSWMSLLIVSTGILVVVLFKKSQT